MEKFSVCKLSDLNEGDRFYFPSNKNKVCQFISRFKEGFSTKYSYTEQSKVIIDTLIDKRVVFLRNINN